LEIFDVISGQWIAQCSGVNFYCIVPTSAGFGAAFRFNEGAGVNIGNVASISIEQWTFGSSKPTYSTDGSFVFYLI
jgi:hypothetical protein